MLPGKPSTPSVINFTCSNIVLKQQNPVWASIVTFISFLFQN